MRARKVHRKHFNIMRRDYYTACGLGVHPGGVVAVVDDSFAWLPRRVQCDRCVEIWSLHGRIKIAWHDWTLDIRDRPNATAEMQTTVETIVLAIHRIGQTSHEHRCFHREFYGMPAMLRCSCGKATVLDMRHWTFRASYAEVLSSDAALEPWQPQTHREVVEYLDSLEWRPARSRCAGAID